MGSWARMYAPVRRLNQDKDSTATSSASRNAKRAEEVRRLANLKARNSDTRGRAERLEAKQTNLKPGLPQSRKTLALTRRKSGCVTRSSKKKPEKKIKRRKPRRQR